MGTGSVIRVGDAVTVFDRELTNRISGGCGQQSASSAEADGRRSL